MGRKSVTSFLKRCKHSLQTAHHRSSLTSLFIDDDKALEVRKSLEEPSLEKLRLAAAYYSTESLDRIGVTSPPLSPPKKKQKKFSKTAPPSPPPTSASEPLTSPSPKKKQDKKKKNPKTAIAAATAAAATATALVESSLTVEASPPSVLTAPPPLLLGGRVPRAGSGESTLDKGVRTSILSFGTLNAAITDVPVDSNTEELGSEGTKLY